MKRSLLALSFVLSACQSSESPVASADTAATLAGDTSEAPQEDAAPSDDAAGSAEDASEAPDVGIDDAGPAEECPLPGPRPQAISEHAAVYDQARQRLVLFGGNPEFPVQCQGKNSYTAEVWAYRLDCNAWVQLTGGPSARGRSGAALVPGAAGEPAAMYVWGGRFREKGVDGFTPYTMLSDLWRLDLATDEWSEVAVKGKVPPGRHSSIMAYDPKGHRLLLFGGSTNPSGATFTPVNTTHAFDLATSEWSLLDTASNPDARLYPAGAVDTDRNLFVVMQGGDENAFLGPFLGDVFGLDLETLSWGRLHAGGNEAPDNRIWSTTAYVPGLQKFVLFGGHDDGALGNRNDLWVFDPAGQTWLAMQLNDAYNKPPLGVCDFPADFATITEGTPERRGAHVMVYAPDRNRVYVHGGKTDCGLIDDLWELDLETWTWTDLEPASIGESCLRYSDSCTGHCN